MLRCPVSDYIKCIFNVLHIMPCRSIIYIESSYVSYLVYMCYCTHVITSNKSIILHSKFSF